MLPASLLMALEGVFPLTMITASLDGVPNITNLSKIWPVDICHVAVANQLLNKSAKNLKENPLVLFRAIDTSDLKTWELEATYVRTESEGSLYKRISDDLETISWMAGASDPASLQSAMIFQVDSVRKWEKDPDHIPQEDWCYFDLLQIISNKFAWNNSSFWAHNEKDSTLHLVVTHGMPPALVHDAGLESMKRLAALVMSRGTVVRLRNIRSHLRYFQTVRIESDRQAQEETNLLPNKWARELKTSFLGIPLFCMERIIGVVCCEAANEEAEAFNRYDDDFLQQLSHRLGEAVITAETVQVEEYRPLFRQVIERLLLEWEKSRDPFHTVLSARERQVAVCVAKGMTNEEIARALFISKRTVTTHMERIYQKLAVASRAVLARYVVEKGLLDTANMDDV